MKAQQFLRNVCIVATFGCGLASADERVTSLPSETPATFTPSTEQFDYVKREFMIPMRDGVKLKTFILIPKGAKNAPMLLTRTPYDAGNRGASWLKIKKVHRLDLVVIAVEWGSGRRKGWLSNIHLGARDGSDFVMLGKTFKGMTDEMLAWQTEQLLKLEIGRDEYTVYVQPKLVVEIAFSDLQVSPRYPSGLALRFARVKRYRTDKPAEAADTFETVQKLAGIKKD